MLKLGLIEGSSFITYNNSGRFTSSFVDIKVVSNLSPWMNCMNVGEIYTSPIATDEGRIILGEDKHKLIENGQIATTFHLSNPTDSELAVESLTSEDGRVFGAISSIDRLGENLYKNVELKGRHKIFESGVKYFG